jgi:hypothetical protein
MDQQQKLKISKLAAQH